ncbi:hypothetical protein AB0C76_38750 [Kitasatospora sp. NPDC048722]|uniref:hypothetical protein n=1 Tax=Kitasatospora sp. NPDC048722 TaxID=3155639 RepID=UPI0033F9F579
MDTRQDELRRDLDATLQARKELGKEYESELVDSFLKRLDARMDARADRPAPQQFEGYEPGYRHRPRRSGWSAGRPGSRLAVLSLVLGIPLTAIASDAQNGGLLGLITCWAGIVGVNFAAARADRRDREDRRPRSDWD